MKIVDKTQKLVKQNQKAIMIVGALLVAYFIYKRAFEGYGDSRQPDMQENGFDLYISSKFNWSKSPTE